jgi:threonine dehydrogenase-like Zn-dependent dehydrogenase
VGVFPARREVRLVDHPEPRIARRTEVKLRMLEIGVCGTDRELTEFAYGSAPPGEDYFVLGHEALAEVVETGAAVETVRPGDLVVPMVRRPCPHPHCSACRSGHQDFCETGDYTERGIKELHGFMTELVVEDAAFVHPVPEGLRDVAVLVEPLTIAEKALLQVAAIRARLPWPQPTARAVVLGAGPVGLLGAMALVHAGFATWVCSREQPGSPRAAIVRAIGADYLWSEQEPIAGLASRVGNIDVVYEATGGSAFALGAMRDLGANGVYVLTGFPGPAEAAGLDAPAVLMNLILKNQAIVGTVNAGHEPFQAAVRDLAAFRQLWPEAVAGLITSRYPLEGFADAVAARPRAIKNVVAVSGGPSRGR